MKWSCHANSLFCLVHIFSQRSSDLGLWYQLNWPQVGTCLPIWVFQDRLETFLLSWPSESTIFDCLCFSNTNELYPSRHTRKVPLIVVGWGKSRSSRVWRAAWVQYPPSPKAGSLPLLRNSIKLVWVYFERMSSEFILSRIQIRPFVIQRLDWPSTPCIVNDVWLQNRWTPVFRIKRRRRAQLKSKFVVLIE